MKSVAKTVVSTVAKRREVCRAFGSCPVLCIKVEVPINRNHSKHRSDAESLISKVPVIEVAGHVAVCDGGSGALGHPVEYIQLDTVSKEPAVCKYCGLRFKMGAVHHH